MFGRSGKQSAGCFVAHAAEAPLHRVRRRDKVDEAVGIQVFRLQMTQRRRINGGIGGGWGCCGGRRRGDLAAQMSLAARH